MEKSELEQTKVYGQRLIVEQDPRQAITATGIITKQGLYPDDSGLYRGRVVAIGQIEGVDIKVGDQIVYSAPKFVDDLIQIGLDKRIYSVVEFYAVVAVVPAPEGDLKKAIEMSRDNLYKKIEKDKSEENKVLPRGLQK